MNTLKKTAIRTGIVLTGTCGVVLLGGGKIVSGTMLIATTFLMVSPLWRHRIPRWIHIALLCLVFGLVAWNISTTDLPGTSNVMVAGAEGCQQPHAEMFPRTGIRFVDQMALILAGFLDQAQPS